MSSTQTPKAPGAPGPEAPPRAAHTRRRLLMGGAAVLGLAATGTSAWALDRFVIDHTEISDVAAYEAAHSSVTIARASTGSGSDALTYYAADVVASDATVVRSAFANNEYGTNITARPSEIAAEHDAVLAVNGDYYGFRTDGILIRNGVIYRDDGVREGIALYADGRVEVYDETATTAQALVDAGVWNTCSFGPALVNGGTVLQGIDDVEVDTNFGNHSIQGNQPRTALGWVGTGHYMLVVVDGRDEGYSRGATMTELARIMADLGCQVAYNLDGGGSSAMYWNGGIINRPSNGGERATSDILYIAQGA